MCLSLFIIFDEQESEYTFIIVVKEVREIPSATKRGAYKTE